MKYTTADARSIMHAHNIDRDHCMNKARRCKDLIGRHGHPYSPTVRGIVAQHIKNARFHNHQAMRFRKYARS